MGPEGTCVLCRRVETSGRSGLYERVALLALGMLAVGLAGAWVGKRGAAPAAASTAVAVAVAEAPRGSASADEPLDAPATTTAAPSPSARPRATAVAALPQRAASPVATAPEDPAATQRERDRARRAEVDDAMHRVAIRVYSTQSCPHCTKAKAWLSANRYAYTELDVEASPENKAAHRALNPRGGVPTIDVEGDVLVGFRAASLESAIRRAAERRVDRF
jgi:glutaredoxin